MCYTKVTEHIGNSFVIFGYNGRDGVVTDKNGLIYMRARYYSPEMKRFVNADILHGTISDSTSLNRYSYVNGNPVSFVDPFGLSAEHSGLSQAEYETFVNVLYDIFNVSETQNFIEFKINMGQITYYQDYEVTLGSGPVDINKLIESQIELSKSFDFSKGTFKRTVGTEILLGIEYSVDIDDYNSVSASVSFKYDGTMNAEYQISTEYKKISICQRLGELK